MVNVTAQFPNGAQIQHVLADPATVLDLKNAVIADMNSPAGFFNVPAGNLIVSTVANGVLADADPLVNNAVYDLDLVQVNGDDGGQDDGDDSGYDADDEGDDVPDGYRAPPNSPRGGAAGGVANGHGNGIVADGYVVYVYVNSAAGTSGPQEYSLEANSNVAALKDKIVADSGSPLARVAAGDVAVYDGSKWLTDSDQLTGGAAYTVQQVSAQA